MAGELIARQRPCGAIHEFLGTPGMGMDPPKSNEDYAQGEGSIIQSEVRVEST